MEELGRTRSDDERIVSTTNDGSEVISGAEERDRMMLIASSVSHWLVRLTGHAEAKGDDVTRQQI